MIDLAFLNELKKFSLVVRKRVTSKYIGPKRSIMAGGGMVFKDYRMYSPGDDFRAIDWKVYGRTNHLIVKTFEEERNLEVHIVLDVSKSMDYGGKINKFEYAAMIGVGFAYLALRDNSKFNFSTFSNELETFKSKRGMRQLAEMVDYLNKSKTKGESKMLAAMTQYKNYISSKSMIILISDFLIGIDEIKEALLRLSKHEVKVVQILDKEETDIGIEGDYKLKDSETSEMTQTFISNRLRLKFRDELDKHTAEIRDACGKLGYSFYQITTDKPLFDAFYEILE